MLKRSIIILSVLLVLVFGLFGAYWLYLNLAYPLKYTDSINDYTIEYGVEKELVLAVINTESHFDPEALSSRGAMGLMQIMPSTAIWIADEIQLTDFSPNDLYVPSINIRMGVFYLSYLLSRFETTTAAIAAYNAGETRVRSWLMDSEYSSDQINLNTIPYVETDNYVKKVMRAKTIYEKRLEKE